MKNKTVFEALVEESIELLEGYVDVKDGEHGPRPNNAMRAVQLLEDALQIARHA